MKTAVRPSLICVRLVCAILGASAAASAQPLPKPLTESLHGPAQEAYASARILFNNNDFARALSKYRQAYELSKDARLLFDMAICQKNLRAYAQMQKLLLQYEREEGPRITPDDKQTVDNALAAVKNLVGAVSLSVNEAGATVAVDGESVGTTPLPQPLVLDLGPRRFVVAKPGFESIDKTIEVGGGSATTVVLALVPQLHVAHLVVTAEPEATVSIDNGLTSRGRFDGTLPAGAHEVCVTESGKRDYKAQVELRDGETRTVDVTLESEKHGAVWPWVIAGTVVAAGAAVGGYFLFKPQDTTTPVPPGKLTQVSFTVWGR